MNQAILSGNLVADMEVRDLGEQHLGTFRLACDDGGERPIFIPVECWNMPHLPDYLRKGSKVLVSGRLKLNEWETDAGEKRSRVVLNARRVEFLSPALRGGERDDRPAAREARRAERTERAGGGCRADRGASTGSARPADRRSADRRRRSAA